MGWSRAAVGGGQSRAAAEAAAGAGRSRVDDSEEQINLVHDSDEDEAANYLKVIGELDKTKHVETPRVGCHCQQHRKRTRLHCEIQRH